MGLTKVPFGEYVFICSRVLKQIQGIWKTYMKALFFRASLSKDIPSLTASLERFLEDLRGEWEARGSFLVGEMGMGQKDANPNGDHRWMGLF